MALGAVPLLVSLLQADLDEALKEQAAATLSCLAAFYATNRSSIIDAGALPLVVELLGASEVSTVKEAATLLSNLGKTYAREVLEAGGMSSLEDMLTMTQDDSVREVVSEALKTLQGGVGQSLISD
ncbi:unnamed protein product [Polarella glacialis]|uniref:Armadillo repeat-containing protein 8 n=1 Tax=Polarella glacialis TaxID=89957 RepID=A0A813EVJ9_POLGL|nr:unnamed protein product [Polarella glacialis]